VTARAGLALVAEVDRALGVTEAFETSVGWLKQRRRGLGIGEVLVSAAESMPADGDFMCELDHLRADRAGAMLRAVPEPPAPSTFALAAGRLGRRGCARLEVGMGTPIGRWFVALPAARRAQLGACRPSIDLEALTSRPTGARRRRWRGTMRAAAGAIIGSVGYLALWMLPYIIARKRNTPYPRYFLIANIVAPIFFPLAWGVLLVIAFSDRLQHGIVLRWTQFFPKPPSQPLSQPPTQFPPYESNIRAFPYGDRK
jgi:uncharacterized membrane protein YhdT